MGTAPIRRMILVVCVVATGACDSSVRGRITSFGTGEPVAGAEVALWDTECETDWFLFIPYSHDCESWIVVATTTDAEGRYELPGVPTDEVLGLVVTAEGYLDWSQDVHTETFGVTVDVELMPAPPAQPNELLLRSLGAEGLEVSWDLPEDPLYAGTLLLRGSWQSGPGDEDRPTHGTSYEVGDLLGSGVVVYSGAEGHFVDHDLEEGQQVSYAAFVYSEVPVYSEGLWSGRVTYDGTPPPPPADVAVVCGSLWVDINLVVPDGAESVLVVRGDGAPLEGGPEPGVDYDAGDEVGGGTVVRPSCYDWCPDNDFLPGVTHYYGFYAFDEARNYSEAVEVEITCPPG